MHDAEYNSIDYEKTKEITILELQEQLSAAQNQIKIITETPKAEPIIIEDKTEIELEDDVVSKHRDFSFPLLLIIIFLLCVLLFGVFLNLKNNSDEDIPEQSQYVEEVAEEEENVFSELTELLEAPIPFLLTFLITGSCVRIGIKFIHSVN